jgi:hypothetical protein
MFCCFKISIKYYFYFRQEHEHFKIWAFVEKRFFLHFNCKSNKIFFFLNRGRLKCVCLIKLGEEVIFKVYKLSKLVFEFCYKHLLIAKNNNYVCTSR